MKVLKKKFRKIKKITKPILKPIVRKPKVGRWCKYYEGRLPFPTECSMNKDMPITRLFKDGKSIVLRDRSECVKCDRNPHWIHWKNGVWSKVINEINKGEDLSDMPAPIQEIQK